MSNTPEEAAAVDAMRSELRRHRANTANGKCVCGWAPDPDGHRSNQFQDHVESSVLAVLLSPTKKPCAECGGQAVVQRDGWTCGCGRNVRHVVDCGRPAPTDPCPVPDCTDGFVLGPAPIEGLLEQVGNWNWDHRGFYFDPEFVADVSWPAFRLPPKVREG